jgi:protein MPE1
LLEHEFVCPNCESKIGSLDKLKPDEETRTKVEEYVKGQVEKNKELGLAAEGGEGGDAKKEDGSEKVSRVE